MEQQFVLTHRYTILQKTENTLEVINGPTLKHVVFLRNQKDNQFLLTTFSQEGC
jgi:hypothetical protein